MSERISHIIKPVCFVLIFVIAFSFVAEVFRKENGAIVRTFYQEKTNSLDVVFIGPSTTYASVYPMELWEEYGIASYLFSSPAQSFPSTYFALREAVTQQTPKLIVIDVFLGASNNNKISTLSFQHLFTDTLRFSPIKIECIESLIDDGKSEFYVPFLTYHSRWKELKKTDFIEKKNYGKGSMPNFSVSERTLNEWKVGTKTEELGDISHEYLMKIIQFCKEKQLNVLFTAPANNSGNTQIQRRINTISNIVQENGYPFLNLRNSFEEIGIDVTHDFRDDNHPNSYGGSKITKYIGKYLTENYDLPDRRQDPAYSSWNKDLEVYKVWNNNFKLPQINNIAEYLNSIDLDSYTIVMAVRDDAQKYFSSQMNDLLKKNGLEPFSDEDFRASYIAVIDSGQVVYQKKSTQEELEAELTIGNAHYRIISSGWEIGDNVSILVNGTECAIGKRGINIVVYDKWSGNVVDKVCFDTHVEETKCYRK